MEQKYIIEDGFIIGVGGEEFFKEESFKFNEIELRVLITKAPLDSLKEGYYNVYIISDMFKQEPINNLDLQEPYKYIESLTEKELSRFMEERAISFYLWFKYNRDYNITSEKI